MMNQSKPDDIQLHIISVHTDSHKAWKSLPESVNLSSMLTLLINNWLKANMISLGVIKAVTCLANATWFPEAITHQGSGHMGVVIYHAASTSPYVYYSIYTFSILCTMFNGNILLFSRISWVSKYLKKNLDISDNKLNFCKYITIFVFMQYFHCV